MRRFPIILLFATLLGLVSCGKDSVRPECRSNAECDDGFLCQGGSCVEDDNNRVNNTNNLNNSNNLNNALPCEDDSECKDDEFCGNGFCLPAGCNIPDAPFCRQWECDDSGCSEEICITRCPPGLTPEVCDCVEAPCMVDSECDDGSICTDEGRCGPCTSDDQCGEEEVCTEGLCVPELTCNSDADCPADKVCNNEGYCVDRPECLLDQDCGDDELCIGGSCTLAPECRADLDCPDGFECIAGNCFEALCRGPGDCENGQLCDAGECIDPPIAASCFVATPNGVITANQTVALEAFALDANGNGIAATFSWTSSAPQVASVDSTGVRALGGASAGVATFTATLASGTPVMCSGSAQLTNPGPVTPNQLRVLVVHAETGAPINGATVVVGTSSATTANGGIAPFPQQTGAFDISVFHPDYNYLTLQGVQSNDVRIPLAPQRGSGPIAGLTGEFDMSGVGSSGNINVGLAGASIAGGLTDLDLFAILGEPFVAGINIPGIVNQDFPVPGGLVAYGRVFGFNIDIKRTYYASATGGARFAWGLAGKIPAQDLFDLGQGGGGNDILTTILPLFNRFDHIAQPILLNEQPRIMDTADINGNGDTMEMVPNYGAFPTVDLRPSVRQNLFTDVDISNFPMLPGGQGELAILLGGTFLNAPGLVPLGISATNDEDGDGRPDARRLSIAPASGSLAGGRYTIVAIAFRTDGIGGSFDFPANISVALWNGQSFPTAVRLGTFPDQSVATITNATRTISFTADAGPMYRVRIVGDQRSWDVWSVGTPGMAGSFAHTMVIPPAAAGATDVFPTGAVLLDAIQTNATMNDLVQPSGIGLRDVGLVTSSFSRTEIR